MSEKKDRIRAASGAIIFHLLLLIMLFFMALITPLPLPEEEGVEVNLGFSDMGNGNQQRTQPIEQPKPPIPTPSTPPQEQIEEEIVQQETEEAPAITEKPAEKPKQEVVKEKPVEQKEIEEKPIEVQKPQEIVEEVEPEPDPEPVIDPRLIYNGKKTKTGDSNEGNDKEAGDKGKVTGDPNSNGYDGLGGKGNGVSYSLGQRKAKALPKPIYDSEDQGKVVVSIWVDKSGKVTRAEIMQKGTNVTDIKLRNMARQAALKAKFTPDIEAAEVQKGSITYNFIKLN